MIRDIIDSLLAGGLLSFLPIWEVDAGEQLVLALALAVLVYMGILFLQDRTEGRTCLGRQQGN